MQAVRSLKLIARNVVVSTSRNYGKVHKTPTFNDLPVPEGDFFVLHHKRQRKNNAVLAAGILMFGSAIYTVRNTDLINFNWTPPKSLD